MYSEDDIPPYYVDGPNSARVDMVSAISLLSQYCNSLPCDKYTTLAPELYFKEKEMSSGDVIIQVVIVLPTICPIMEPIEVRLIRYCCDYVDYYFLNTFRVLSCHL